MNLPRTFASFSFLVALVDMLLRVSALQLDHTYPLQGNYSRVRLRCKRNVDFMSNARYYLNGSLITADSVLGYVQSSVAVSYTITQDTEGAVRCESEAGEVSEEVLLAGNCVHECAIVYAWIRLVCSWQNHIRSAVVVMSSQ